MPSISHIPKPYIEGFKALASIDDATFSLMAQAISDTSFKSNVRNLANEISSERNLPPTTIEKILSSVGSLVSFLDQGVSIEELGQDISNIVVKDSHFDLGNQKDGTFVQRLSVLLKSEVLYFAAKANELVTDNGCVFIQARIVTDIRPIFNVSVEESPKAGVIFHNLHIHYHSNGNSDHRDIYLALDSKDIKVLQESLARAEKKQISLRSVFEKTGMINLSE